jgi:hypothetical protein
LSTDVNDYLGATLGWHLPSCMSLSCHGLLRRSSLTCVLHFAWKSVPISRKSCWATGAPGYWWNPSHHATSRRWSSTVLVRYVGHGRVSTRASTWVSYALTDGQWSTKKVVIPYLGSSCFSCTHAMPLHRRACVLKNSQNALAGRLLS